MKFILWWDNNNDELVVKDNIDDVLKEIRVSKQTTEDNWDDKMVKIHKLQIKTLV